MPSNPRRHGAGRVSDRRPRESAGSDRPPRNDGERGPRAEVRHTAPPPQADVEAAPPDTPAGPDAPGASAAPAPQRPSLNIAVLKDMSIHALKIGRAHV